MSHNIPERANGVLLARAWVFDRARLVAVHAHRRATTIDISTRGIDNETIVEKQEMMTNFSRVRHCCHVEGSATEVVVRVEIFCV